MPNVRSVVWAPRATEDLTEIWAYHADVISLESANVAIRNVAATISGLQSRPTPGRPRRELAPDLRSVRSHPYVIFFRLQDAHVAIVRILHERRDLTKGLGEEA